VDPYEEDSSWIKNTEKRFREEDRYRERQIELAKKEDQRYNQLVMRLRSKGKKKLPAKKTILIPLPRFPEFDTKLEMTEAEIEASLMDEERKLEEEDAATSSEVICKCHLSSLIRVSLSLHLSPSLYPPLSLPSIHVCRLYLDSCLTSL
jgi:hypothetical protein